MSHQVHMHIVLRASILITYLRGWLIRGLHHTNIEYIPILVVSNISFIFTRIWRHDPI